jgi:hypothetical protein
MDKLLLPGKDLTHCSIFVNFQPESTFPVMKDKIIPALLLTAILLASCKKHNLTAEGPTDVRIQNLTGELLEEVTVTTHDDPAYTVRSHNFGTVVAGAYTEYFRYDIAFSEADVTAKIGNTTFTTTPTDFDYLTYIGPDRITYRITITDNINHVLDIETIIEEPIDDL